MISDDLDLQALTEDLKGMVQNHGPVGYLRGKSLMRDLLVEKKNFSQLDAEDLIDTLEMQGYLHFLGNTSERSETDSPWEIKPHH